MRLLLDHDVYFRTGQLLRGLGHDVVTAAELGLAQAADADLLALAQTQDRILITRDRDFGALVFLKGLGAGVICVRASPSATGAVHQELVRVLRTYQQDDLRRAFVTVEPGQHRFRCLAR